MKGLHISYLTPVTIRKILISDPDGPLVCYIGILFEHWLLYIVVKMYCQAFMHPEVASEGEIT